MILRVKNTIIREDIFVFGTYEVRNKVFQEMLLEKFNIIDTVCWQLCLLVEKTIE